MDWKILKVEVIIGGERKEVKEVLSSFPEDIFYEVMKSLEIEDDPGKVQALKPENVVEYRIQGRETKTEVRILIEIPEHEFRKEEER